VVLNHNYTSIFISYPSDMNIFKIVTIQTCTKITLIKSVFFHKQFSAQLAK